MQTSVLGERLKDVQPCRGASHRQCKFKLEESERCTNVLGSGTRSQRHQKAGLALLKQEKNTVSTPRRENLWTPSCEGWDASPVHGAVSALQDKLRTGFAQGVCPTGNGAELLSAYPAHRLLCGQDPPGWKAADSLTGPKGASSNRCSRKWAIFVFMEIPLTVSRSVRIPSFSERESYAIVLPHSFGFLVIKM